MNGTGANSPRCLTALGIELAEQTNVFRGFVVSLRLEACRLLVFSVRYDFCPRFPFYEYSTLILRCRRIRSRCWALSSVFGSIVVHRRNYWDESRGSPFCDSKEYLVLNNIARQWYKICST